MLNAVTNEPLRKVTLTLRMNVAALQTQRGQQPVATTYTVTSDAMGKFAFANVDPGDYQLHARARWLRRSRAGQYRQRPQGGADPAWARRPQAQLHGKMIPYGALAGDALR